MPPCCSWTKPWSIRDETQGLSWTTNPDQVKTTRRACRGRHIRAGGDVPGPVWGESLTPDSEDPVPVGDEPRELWVPSHRCGRGPPLGMISPWPFDEDPFGPISDEPRAGRWRTLGKVGDDLPGSVWKATLLGLLWMIPWFGRGDCTGPIRYDFSAPGGNDPPGQGETSPGRLGTTLGRWWRSHRAGRRRPMCRILTSPGSVLEETPVYRFCWDRQLGPVRWGLFGLVWEDAEGRSWATHLGRLLTSPCRSVLQTIGQSVTNTQGRPTIFSDHHPTIMETDPVSKT
jgi:hypothetical protein